MFKVKESKSIKSIEHIEVQRSVKKQQSGNDVIKLIKNSLLHSKEKSKHYPQKRTLKKKLHFF